MEVVAELGKVVVEQKKQLLSNGKRSHLRAEQNLRRAWKRCRASWKSRLYVKKVGERRISERKSLFSRQKLKLPFGQEPEKIGDPWKCCIRQERITEDIEKVNVGLGKVVLGIRKIRRRPKKK